MNTEIISSRLFACSRERLFAAFSDPQQLTVWFGPKGFTSTFKRFNFQVGGEWAFTFHGPTGTDYANRCTFIEIVPNERIVYDHLSLPNFRMTMMFADEDGGTRLVWCMAFATAVLCGQLSPICVPANEESFDRLEAHLAAMI